MSLFIRQMILAVISFLLFAFFLLGLTFMAFPLDNWSLLWQQRIYDVPYLSFVMMMIIITGILIGAFHGAFWKKKLKMVSVQLDDLIKGQKRSINSANSSPELLQVQRKLDELDEKMMKQAELSQKLATERATDRERSLQEVVVQERTRLARELHDSVSQQLFAASMMMATINETNPPKDETMKKQLVLVEKMIDQSQLEMRALLLHLRPVALKGKSLKEGIEELLAELTEKVPLKIESKLEEFPLDKGVEDHLFRILQESVSNTLRHASANQLQVVLIERDDNVILRIADDGKGFNVQEVTSHGSYGLTNMHERAIEIGGTLKVVSVEQEGTRLEVKVPAIKRGDQRND
ncbi:two-component sensor histidine kinase [Salipaludibacillus keqinensis]|uniref:Sensor histidine kinase n=1 Tax=Salipaludibacillus keqinensis TaxID=2045207 RepID=A0A323TJ88_9BACI|nr:sensor histidine kinase [Salipaludibacillus keqinensis]PYZ93647.1 two-component sensor histidine kinase [Salipaludibacillus keqinensis]